MKIRLFSFGFSHGPAEADYVFDLRFLPNPYWVPELSAHPGTTPQVAAYVLDKPETEDFLAVLQPFLKTICTAWTANGKRPVLTIALGCTGGFHRSVAITEYLAKWLSEQGFQVESGHRDLPETLR